MFGLDNIVLNNALSVDNNGENIYSPYIKGFSTKITTSVHQGTPLFFSEYLKVNLTEYGSTSTKKLRAVFVQGQMRTLQTDSRLMACQFTHAVVFKEEEDELIVDFNYEVAAGSYASQQWGLLGIAPIIGNFSEIPPQFNSTEQTSVVENSDILTFKIITNRNEVASNSALIAYTSGIYYVI